jgi:hypothetical protein
VRSVAGVTKLLASHAGIKTDLYDADIWRFVGAFLVGACCSMTLGWAASWRASFTLRMLSLAPSPTHPAIQMLRGIALAACALLFGGLLRRTLGEVVANWLSTTWISTGRRGWSAALGACLRCLLGRAGESNSAAPAWLLHLAAFLLRSPLAVILGVPLLRALLGPQYANLGVVAGISSFVFQLPLMLLLFEVGSIDAPCS